MNAIFHSIFMQRPSKNLGRSVLPIFGFVLFLVSSGGVMAQNFNVGFNPKFPNVKPGTAALLLTPEQTAALQSAATEMQAVAAPIAKLGNQATPEQLKERQNAITAYTQKVDGILTAEQKDIRALIAEIYIRTEKGIRSEYAQGIELAATPQEKAALVAEMKKTVQERYLDELKFSLSPERLAAYQSAATP